MLIYFFLVGYMGEGSIFHREPDAVFIYTLHVKPVNIIFHKGNCVDCIRQG